FPFYSLYFFFYALLPPPHLHSFPTRRSSDLTAIGRKPHFARTNIVERYLLSPYFSSETLSDAATLGNGALVPVDLPYSWDPFNRSEEHTSELQSRSDLVCRLLLEKKNKK